jgi:hypothetical protein
MRACGRIGRRSFSLGLFLTLFPTSHLRVSDPLQPSRRCESQILIARIDCSPVQVRRTFDIRFEYF